MPPYLLHRMRLAGRLLVVLRAPYEAYEPTQGDGNLQSQTLHKTDATSKSALCHSQWDRDRMRQLVGDVPWFVNAMPLGPGSILTWWRTRRGLE